MNRKDKAKAKMTYTVNQLNGMVRLMNRYPSLDRRTQRTKEALQHKAKKLKNFC